MSRSVTEMVLALVDYAEDRDLIDPEERAYTANLLLDALRLETDETFHPSRRASAPSEVPSLEEILKVLLDDAVERKLIDGGIASRDLFDTRLMSCVTPRPGQVQQEFWSRYDVSPKAATDWFYQLSKDSDYIRTYRIARDRKWQTATPYGLLDITINLSKPEKDPKAIAAALNARQGAYPQCLLCRENEGYAGRLDHPARQTIRLIPLTLAGERWYLQYSPYVYYREHCIVLKD